MNNNRRRVLTGSFENETLVFGAQKNEGKNNYFIEQVEPQTINSII